MVYAKEAKAAGSHPRALAEALAASLRQGGDVAAVEVAGPGFLNIRLKPEAFEAMLRAALTQGDAFGAGPTGRGAGQRRICQRQSDGADACRPWPRRRVRRRAREPAGVCRPQGDARILHQRRRRPGRRARPLGLPALPRGARRGDRGDPGRPLSRRLPEGRRRGARRRIRRAICTTWRRPSGCRSCASAPSRR